MNIIAWGEMKRLKADELNALLPVLVEVNTEPMFVIGNPEGTLIINDLHPRVQIQLKEREKLARSGMSNPVMIDVDKILKARREMEQEES